MNPSLTPVRIAVAAAMLSSSAFAQQARAAEQAEAALEEVTVTGSRISSANMTSASPILSVTSEDIKTGGRMDISDMLNQLPQINANYLGQDLGNKTSGLTSAGGVATASLRGLGPNRTLVLVDGRRLGAGSPQTVISAPAPTSTRSRACWWTALKWSPAALPRFTAPMPSPASSTSSRRKTSKACSWMRSWVETGTTTPTALPSSA